MLFSFFRVLIGYQKSSNTEKDIEGLKRREKFEVEKF